MNVGFRNRNDADRAVRILKRAERSEFLNRPDGMLGGLVIRPGELYSDTDYREAVVTWLDAETGDYTDDTTTVLVRSHGDPIPPPPPEGLPVFCTLHGYKDDLAVYVATVLMPIQAQCTTTTYLPSLAPAVTEGGAVVFLDARSTTSSLAQMFVQDEWYDAFPTGETESGYPVYISTQEHREKCDMAVCVDGVDRIDTWRIPGWHILEGQDCDVGVLDFSDGGNSGLIAAVI